MFFFTGGQLLLQGEALVLLRLMAVLDQREAEHAREPGNRLVIVADDQGDVGEVGQGVLIVIYFTAGSARINFAASTERASIMVLSQVV